MSFDKGSPKKKFFFLVARLLSGGGGYRCATNEKRTLFSYIYIFKPKNCGEMFLSIRCSFWPERSEDQKRHQKSQKHSTMKKYN